MEINIAKDFSVTPGFRYKKDGEYSGELFRETKLEPLFENENFKEPITINLDGAVGYATSFLDEAFGGLARKYGVDTVISRLKFISDEEPLLIEEIQEDIYNCAEEK